MEVAPRYGNRSSSSNDDDTTNNEVLKPHTGMTIRLTPEILAILVGPGPKPKIELVLKRPEEGELSVSCGVSC